MLQSTGENKPNVRNSLCISFAIRWDLGRVFDAHLISLSYAFFSEVRCIISASYARISSQYLLNEPKSCISTKRLLRFKVHASSTPSSFLFVAEIAGDDTSHAGRQSRCRPGCSSSQERFEFRCLVPCRQTHETKWNAAVPHFKSHGIQYHLVRCTGLHRGMIMSLILSVRPEVH